MPNATKNFPSAWEGRGLRLSLSLEIPPEQTKMWQEHTHYPMVFKEWLELSASERESEKQNWHVFEPGYWHAMANEAAGRFAAEFANTKGVRRICKSLYRSDELIIAVQTDAQSGELLPLPESYLGFRVLQFAGQTPEGVLVDVSPPSQAAV